MRAWCSVSVNEGRRYDIRPGIISHWSGDHHAVAVFPHWPACRDQVAMPKTLSGAFAAMLNSAHPWCACAAQQLVSLHSPWLCAWCNPRRRPRSTRATAKANGDSTHHQDQSATGPMARYFSSNKTIPKPSKYIVAFHTMRLNPLQHGLPTLITMAHIDSNPSFQRTPA